MQYGLFIIYLKFNKVFQLTIQEYYDFINTFKTFKLIRTENHKLRHNKSAVFEKTCFKILYSRTAFHYSFYNYIF